MDFQKIRSYLETAVHNLMPKHLERLNWTRKQILDFQLEQLKSLLKHVIQHSSFYKNHLGSLDLAKFKLTDLNHFPILTKQEVLNHWNDIICVPDLTKSKAEEYLQACRDNKSPNLFYNNQYYITATGGLSGLRGLFIWDRDYFSEVACVTYRYQIHDEQKNRSASKPRIIAVLSAPHLIHVSTPLYLIRTDTNDIAQHISISAPMNTIIRDLETLQPTHLRGYPTVIVELAHLQLQGKLNISPERIITSSEPLDQEGRNMIKQAHS